MFRLGPPKYSLGIDIGSSSLKFVQLRKTKKGPQIIKHGIEKYAPGVWQDGALQDPNAVIQMIKNLKKEHNLKYDQVFSAISSQSAILRFLPLPDMSDDELEHAIDGEAEQYIPYPLETANVHFCKLDRIEQEGMTRILCILAAAQKKDVETVVDIFKGAGINTLDSLDVDALAIINSLKSYLKRPPALEGEEMIAEEGIEAEAEPAANEFGQETNENEVMAIICIGARKTVINILKGGTLRFSRTSPPQSQDSLGGEDITEIVKAVYKVTFEEAEEIKLQKSRDAMEGNHDEEFADVVESTVSEIALQIRLSLDYYKAQHREPLIHRIVLTGGTARLKGIDTLLSNELGVEVEVGDPSLALLRDLDDEEVFEEHLQEYAVAIGLALRGCDTEEE